MASTAVHNRVICYINGILFYPKAVNVSAVHGDFHYFTVEIPAVPQWDALPPRSHCAVFFADPVTVTWRLMCEGEYISTTRAKQSHGQRSRVLNFRSLHAYWRKTSYTSLVSAMMPVNKTTDVSEMMIRTQAAGHDFTFEFKDGNDLYRINDLEALIDASTVPGKRLIGFMQQFVFKATLQTPVECFYMISRKTNNKFHALDDAEINDVCDYARFRDMIQNGFNNFGLGPCTKLGEIVRAYEDMLFYQHTPVLAPPMLDEGSKILELLFIPHLYSTVPPACNVIFKDQITHMNWSRDYENEPTRVITQMGTEVTGPNNPFPQLYMANSVQESKNFTQFILPDAQSLKSPLVASHALLSEEELLRGVNAVSVNIGLEKLLPNKSGSNNGTSTIQSYMSEASRHQYEIERGKVRACQVSGCFLPYLLTGFPVLVEDPAGPFFGIIDSISHGLPAEGSPTTQVNITYIREAFVRVGTDRNSPIPRWLNSAFHPSKVNQTYKNLFGIDSNDMRGSQSAMVPDSLLSENEIITHADEEPDGENVKAEMVTGVNLDELARAVVETPKYNNDLTPVDDGTNSGQIAARLRKTPYPDKAFREFQYRNGTSLSAYLKFHNLPADGETVSDDATKTPPEDLSPDRSTGHPLFGSPSGLAFVGKSNLEGDTLSEEAESGAQVHYGVYDLAPGAGSDKAEISSVRQKASRTIKDAILKRLSPN